MKIIADSSSTRTEWALVDGDTIVEHAFTQGLNPYFQSRRDISHSIRLEIPDAFFKRRWSHIYFYGAGCANLDKRKIMEASLIAQFKTPATVESDLLGAARGLLVRERGIACILGTGSNACRYDGQAIMPGGVPSLGYILGDEGGGVSLGRRLLSDAAKRQLPDSICNALFAIEGVSIDSIIQHVYRGATPARYLASFVPFIVEHRNEKAIHALLVEEFSRFIRRNILPLQPEIHEAVHFVGGVAKTFCAELEEALYHHTLTLGEVIQAPVDRLENL